MALKQLSSKGNYIDPKTVEVGASIRGYFVGYSPEREAKSKEGRKFTTKDIILRLESGEVKPLSTAGSLKYFEKDYVADGKVTPGMLVVFTRLSNGDKGGVRFAVAADDEDTIDVSSIPAAGDAAPEFKKAAAF